MARHAGFDVVASVREATVNALLQNSLETRGPFFTPLPQSTTVAGVTLSIAGFLQVVGVRIGLRDNPDGLVDGYFSFRTTFAVKIGHRPWTVRTVNVSGNGSASFLLAPSASHLTLSLNTSSVTLGPLTIEPVSGPSIDPQTLAFLQSPAFAFVAANAVRAMDPIAVLGLIPSSFSRTVPASFPSGLSVFEWFTLTVTVGAAVTRVLDAAVSVGINFVGRPRGNRMELIDLTRQSGGGSIYRSVRTDANANDTPILTRRLYKPDVDYAASFNIASLNSILTDQLTPQVAGTMIEQSVVLDSLSVQYGEFDKPLLGKQDGLRLHIIATAYGFGVNVDVYLQPYLCINDDWQSPSSGWLVAVGRVDVDLPWYVDVLRFVVGLTYVPVGIALAIPLLIGAQDLDSFESAMDGYFSGASGALEASNPESAAAKVSAQVSAEPDIASPRLPGDISYISVAPDTIDVGFGRGYGERLIDPVPAAVITPNLHWVYDRNPIQVKLKLSKPWEKLTRATLTTVWEVRRVDTNAVVVTATNPYETNGISIPHASKELYDATDYLVTCRLMMALGGQSGEIWVGQQRIHIEDNIKRNHSFVEWGPRWVHFSNSGTAVDGKPVFWSRLSRSRIHRTAVAARCKMLRRAAASRSIRWFRYRDSLGFSYDDLNNHRKELCEYCFFGGPDKRTPYPQEDWFEKSRFVLRPFGR